MKQFDLDTVLMAIPDKDGKSAWSIRDAVEGVQIFGSIGSGKTSSSGRTLALRYLSHGFGGLVLAAKTDEKQLWEEYCRLTGRLNDLVVIEPGGKERFNFMEYESSQGTAGASLTGNLVQVLKTVIRASEEKTSGKSDDAFWEKALDMLISNVIDLCKLAYGRVSIQQLYDIANTAPRKGESSSGDGDGSTNGKNHCRQAFLVAQRKVDQEVANWFSSLSPQIQASMPDAESFAIGASEAVPNARLLKSIYEFFTESYQNLHDRTRSIIDFSLSGFLYHFLQEPYYSLFCRGNSTVTPEDCLKGKIILVNLPVKSFHQVGRDCQVMFKYIWQRAMEKRNVKQNSRPVFLWADEAQHFLHEHDAEYQATARSSRIATVYISQNLPNYLASMGGHHPEYRVKSFLGTLGTKIFHANADVDTNSYGSSLIGEAYIEDSSRTVTVNGEFSTSQGTSYKLEKMVRPEAFVSLLTGGPLNKLLAQCIIHHQGKPFHNGLNHILATFSQTII